MKSDPELAKKDQEEQLEAMFSNPLFADPNLREVVQYNHISDGFRSLALVMLRALPDNVDKNRALSVLRIAFHHARESARLEIIRKTLAKDDSS